MNTNRLKRFAQEARKKLLEQVASRLELVLSTDSAELREKAVAVGKLREAINATSKEQVIDKVAYTWFNRLMALRFMDANDYQPLGVRVVTPKDGFILPEILEDTTQGQIPDELPVRKQHLFDLLDGKIPSANAQNEVYKELLIGACNHLHSIFPFLFEKINDYTELLLPDDLTSEFSIIQDFLEGMQREDCQEVEVIGWLYQFYISERKDEVFASKSKVKKEDIPAATQLFTPRWIVEYMVQNTVGKLWLQNRPNSKLREHMPYFIESPSVTAEDYLKVDSVEEITLLDQAVGSGHILVYGFELFSKIYEEEGYSPSEIPQLIIEKNLFGSEIDERAAQLTGLAILLKARSYHRRAFNKELKPNILQFTDVVFTQEELQQVLAKTSLDKPSEFQRDIKLQENATIFGSLIIPESSSEFIGKASAQIEESLHTADFFQQEQLERLRTAVRQLFFLSRKHHCIVDNPPYMGGRKMGDILRIWLKLQYPQAHQDLFSCFVVRIKEQLLTNGIASLVTLQGWMFVSTFENFRKWLLNNYNFNSLIQIGGNSFPSLNSQVARAVTFSFQNSVHSNWSTISFDLDSIAKTHSINKRELFENHLENGIKRTRDFKIFKDVSRCTFLHSVSEETLTIFLNSMPLRSFAKPRQGLATGNNEKFVRYWYEVESKKTFNTAANKEELWINEGKWVPYNKGGNFRKWYGNNDSIIAFDEKTFLILEKSGNHLPSKNFYFKKGITYSLIGNSEFCARAYDKGFLFDVGGSGFFPDEESYKVLLGLVNSRVGSLLLSKLNPTVNFQVGDIGNLPVVEFNDIKQKVSYLVDQNIAISKYEWALNEENPDFSNDELIRNKEENDLKASIEASNFLRIDKIQTLYKNEIELDALFSSLYGIPYTEIDIVKKISIFGVNRFKKLPTLSNLEDEWAKEIIQKYLSYSVSCMFGRYSLDQENLILANQGDSVEDYLKKVEKTENKISFLPDPDNIIPVLDDEWFEDDIVGLFYEFLKASFGKENFEKNLAFVEECLGKDVRKYFVKDFYKDHTKRYKKRPIYWMFSSPKGSFNVLIYMHRYTPDTLNKILNNYLLEYREKLRSRFEHLNHIIETGSSIEQTKATKEQDKLKMVLLELQEYEREILYPLATRRTAIDLDDGVLVNYNKFGKAVQEVPGLNDRKTKTKVREFDWIDTETII